MPVIHFLNVNEGDCSVIEHYSGHITVIDVCNAHPALPAAEAVLKAAAALEEGALGNFNQKKYPANPISYMNEHGYNSVFRFILTHPDCDHLDGIRAFFQKFSPWNFWDTENEEKKEFDGDLSGGYSEDDWDFYVNIRDSKPDTDPKRLTLYSGSQGGLHCSKSAVRLEVMKLCFQLRSGRKWEGINSLRGNC